MSRAEVRRQALALADLGRALFFDPSLSGSGKLACSSCHDPAHGFGPANDRVVQFGGGDMQRPGARAVPSLKYLQAVPSFTEHFFDSEDEADESVDNGPTGGLTWTGGSIVAWTRPGSLAVNFEMGSRSEAEVARQLAAEPRRAIAAIIRRKAATDRRTSKSAQGAIFQQDTGLLSLLGKYDAVLKAQHAAGSAGRIQRGGQGQLRLLPYQPARQ